MLIITPFTSLTTTRQDQNAAERPCESQICLKHVSLVTKCKVVTGSSFLSLCQIFTRMLLRSHMHMQVFSCIREASELRGSVICAMKSWLHAHSTFVSFVFCCSSSPRQHMNSDSTEAEVLTHNEEPVTSKLSRLVALKYAP